MTTTTSPMPQTDIIVRETHAGPTPLTTLHVLWEKFEGFWRSSAAADHESAVERYINDRGGALTDDLERDISRRFGRIAGPG